MSQIICITGMHRSGTSLATSWLEKCGLTMNDGSVLGPSVGNPKGNFEDKDFVDMHIRELKSRHPDSKGWQVFSSEGLQFSVDSERQIRNLINTRSEKYSTWGWKDPRTVYFLEEWKRLIPDLKVLFFWRPCGEVVRSLVARSKKAEFDVFKVGEEDSVLLWITYNSLVINYLRNHPDDAILFNIHDLVSSAQSSFNMINDFFGTRFQYSDFLTTYDSSLFSNASIHGDSFSSHSKTVDTMQGVLRSLSTMQCET